MLQCALAAKAPVSISDQQEASARHLAADGRYASLSEIVERGLEFLREETGLKKAELAALSRCVLAVILALRHS